MILFIVSCGEKKVEEDSKVDTTKESVKTEKELKVAVVYSTGGLGDNSYNDKKKRGLENSGFSKGIDGCKIL